MCGFSAAADGRRLSSGRPVHKLRKQNRHSLGSRLSPDTLPAERSPLWLQYDSQPVNSTYAGAQHSMERLRFAKLCANKRSGHTASSAKKRSLRLRTRDAHGPLPREIPRLFTHVRSNPPQRKSRIWIRVTVLASRAPWSTNEQLRACR